MAIQKEIWLADIVEPLYASNTFAAQSVDHSDFVNGTVVHVPNAGSPPEIVKNRSTFPATATRREDTDLTYTLNDYSTDPVHIPNAEAVELSYNKRQSVISQIQLALADKVYKDLLESWWKEASRVGDSSPYGTPIREIFAMAATLMNQQDVPQEGRNAVVSPNVYYLLLKELSAFEGQAFLKSIDAQTGALGKLFGFNVYTSECMYVAETMDDPMFFWHKSCVSRAIGQAELFTDDQNPLYYGDIFSARVRAGGSLLRADKKGAFVMSIRENAD